MTRRTVQELVAQALATLPDNNEEAIRPSHVRNMLVDFLDTFTPMYGGLGIVSKSVNLTTTPATLPFDSIISSYPPEADANPAAGTISRTLGAVAGMTCNLSLNGIVEGPQGTEVIFQFYKNNAALPGKQTESTCEGPTKSVSLHWAGKDFGTVDATYKLMVSVSTGSASITIRNAEFIVDNVPVREIPPAGRLA
jgi:hypothetical protein